VEVEGRVPPATRQALTGLGHDVTVWPDWEWRAGAVCAVKIGPADTRWAAADPRRGSHAIGG
jgi:gamma-glutamyltranspeptidase/glutathione hydrolase